MTKAAAGKIETGAAAPASVAPLRRADDFDRDVWSVLGVPIDRLNTAEALAAIERAARDGERLSFVTPNVNFLVRATRDENERRRLIDADLSLVDGAPLVFFGRLLGMTALTRCAGSDIFEALRKRASFGGKGLRVFFFGGRDGAGEAAAAALKAEGRGLQPVGALNPGFGDIEAMSAPAIIDAINIAAPDFLVVALGASKGQKWIDANQDRLTAPVIAHLGAVVDFTAGTIARAPAFMRALNLEWAWRILAEPSLWRRYWNDGLALVSLSVAKLLPALGGPAATGRPGEARAVAERGAVRILLSGDLCADDLGAVRMAFRAAARGAGDVVLDFTDTGRIDAAFLGQALMLEKAARRRGAAVLIDGAAAPVRRLLKAHSISYPQAPSGVAQSRETGDAGFAAAR
jgi:N-acetylglucosaminyldiphosphoundecaprenol N-acetyl-beta-D-mannosaminyltransferase